MRRATLIIIHPDGRREVSNHAPADRPSYQTLRDAVGGLIQPCAQFMKGARREAYCNEEFLLHGMAPNLEGSKAVNWPVGGTDFLTTSPIPPLHGPIIILEGFDEEEE